MVVWWNHRGWSGAGEAGKTNHLVVVTGETDERQSDR
jgi:hypothetical protein